MEDRDQRAEFWGTRSDGEYGDGCSVDDPYRKHVEIFQGARVLEIGPGGGRQFKALQPLSALYVVADISEKVLAKPVFADAPVFLIETYREDSDIGQFDVVHFWYVLHHVKKEELRDFAAFVARRVAPGGHAYFNTLDPRSGFYGEGELTGDGTNTTAHEIEEVLDVFRKHFQISDVEPLAANCVVVLCTK